jgi:uncharacterized protein (DUF2235 family)
MTTRKGGPRHLIYFIDGTWLWSGSDKNLDVYSNIWRMNLLLDADDDNGRAQIVHYSRGLGAVDDTIEAYVAGGLAFGIDELIADLYVNICSNYQRGDKIYIFGFSRGAVVARSLTGLLSFGILEAHHINMFAHVWAAYTNQSGEVILPGAGRTRIEVPDERRLDYASSCSERHPRIEFVGVFDTVVGGSGVAEKVQRLRLADCKVQPNVKHAVQLLAIDESRKFFKPVFWTGATDPKELGLSWSRPTLEQIWMPGVHSDVGGSYGKRHLGNLALQTMIDRVVARTSLRFDRRGCRELQVITGGDPVRIHDEFENMFRFLGKEARQRNPDAPQLMHPFVEVLEHSNVSYKSEKHLRPYTLSQSFVGMDQSKEFRSDIFSGNCGAAPKIRKSKLPRKQSALGSRNISRPSSS